MDLTKSCKNFPGSKVLLNPRYPEAFRKEVISQLSSLLPSHFWLLTSGTSGEQKAVALSEEALYCSASAVNDHLGCTKKDVWLNPLPPFHVGGLGIFVRAHLCGAQVYAMEKWSPTEYWERCQEATLSALVPTQVYDLVQWGRKAPPSLRAVIVGGGALSDDVYEDAKRFGWPLLPSYGLTECASQVATARDSKELQLLNHVEVKITKAGKIAIKSPALLTAYATLKSNCLEDPKVDGWFETEDVGTLEKNMLTVKGREGDFVKIGGESIFVQELQSALENIQRQQAVSTPLVLIAAPDARLGACLHLMVEGEITQEIKKVVERYHASVLPFERIHSIRSVEKIPRTSLGKVKKAPFPLDDKKSKGVLSV